MWKELCWFKAPGAESKEGGQQLPPTLPQLLSVHTGHNPHPPETKVLQSEPRSKSRPLYPGDLLPLRNVPVKVSSDLSPRFSRWGFQASWTGSCATSPSAGLRHSHHNSSEAQLALKAIRIPTLWCLPQHLHCRILRTPTGSASTCQNSSFLGRKLSGQSTILQT